MYSQLSWKEIEDILLTACLYWANSHYLRIINSLSNIKYFAASEHKHALLRNKNTNE